jgi:hypothetical protein
MPARTDAHRASSARGLRHSRQPAHRRAAAADEAAFAAIERFYGDAGIARHWVLANDYSEPADLDARLRARGYAGDGTWQRVVLQ